MIALSNALSDPKQCSAMQDPQDCRFEGSFACFNAAWPTDAVKGLGRAGYCHKPNATDELDKFEFGEFDFDDMMRGKFDSMGLDEDHTVDVTGWAVDPDSPGNGTVRLTVEVHVDGTMIWTAVANISRPGLVTHHVAPDPNHGLVTKIPRAAAAALFAPGNHSVTLAARRWHAPAGEAAVPIGTPKCVANGRALQYCGGPPAPRPWSCCRLPPNDHPLSPSPPRIASPYPLPPRAWGAGPTAPRLPAQEERDSRGERDSDRRGGEFPSSFDSMVRS